MKFLSHTLSPNTPSYGTLINKLKVSKVKGIEKGDSSNVFTFTMENHLGTHVDAPNHFFEHGKRIVDYPPEYWFFESPQVLRLDLKPDETLINGQWVDKIRDDADILLFQSGWYSLRDKDVYSTNNPGIHPEAASCLRHGFPNLKAIGIDWVSISPYQKRDLGRESHRIFLDPNSANSPILIIEDMDLSCDLSTLSKMVVLPIRVDKLDSAPCIVVGIFQ